MAAATLAAAAAVLLAAVAAVGAGIAVVPNFAVCQALLQHNQAFVVQLELVWPGCWTFL